MLKPEDNVVQLSVEQVETCEFVMAIHNGSIAQVIISLRGMKIIRYFRLYALRA